MTSAPQIVGAIIGESNGWKQLPMSAGLTAVWWNQLSRPSISSATRAGCDCWTNMRTRTKRTRGTENPDAFIRLNMRIVRVTHFSFITQVERQLCIVNQGYTIVTKQQ
jgi:hypothetical protein